MTELQIERFVEECRRRGITITETDKALLGCFRQWYIYDCMEKPVMEVKHGQA